ncbi:hypothetical protein ASU33_13450 [Solirubrum puertoriconensis]|uniref:BLUF domain-containing protein n=1 Tax=Solirubrum puertoriconensis TaxID=1751427 RepID=A0A9X0L492_SOLP1|nr:hypothetical protein ASU33_13450 [Solirubrum puertoriconensis]
MYQSSATNEFSEQELQALLMQSRAWNAAHGLTGVLLYSGGNILQVLEGTEEEVAYIFGRISRDARHHNVTRLADGPITERSFTEWSMGYVPVNADDLANLTGYFNPKGKHPLAVVADHEGPSLHELLTSFVVCDTVRL